MKGGSLDRQTGRKKTEREGGREAGKGKRDSKSPVRLLRGSRLAGKSSLEDGPVCEREACDTV